MTKQNEHTNINLLMDQREDLRILEEIVRLLESDPSKIDEIQPRSKIIKLIESLESKVCYDKIAIIAQVILSHPSSSKYEYELMKSVYMLQNHQMFDKIFDILNKMFEKLLPINQQILLDFIKALNTSKMTRTYTEKLIQLVIGLVTKGYEFNQTLWRNIFDMMKAQSYKYSNEIIRLYPFESNLSDSFIRHVISSYLASNQMLVIFNVFESKYQQEKEQENKKVYHSVFNIFLEELVSSIDNIELKDIRNVYEATLIKYNITVNERTLEKILTKIAINYKQNFEIIEDFLFITGNLLTKRIIEGLLKEYHKLNDVFSIFMLVKLCKGNALPITLDSIELESSLLKRVLYFLIDDSEIDKEECALKDLSYSSRSDDFNCEMSLTKNNYDLIEDRTKILDEFNDKDESFTIITADSILDDYSII